MSGLTADQLPEYCDRLGEEIKKVKGNKEKKSFFKLKNINELTSWNCVRPNMTSDYLDSTTDRHHNITTNQVPVESQEYKLVQDLIASFLGCNTDYIKAMPLQHKYDKRTFKISQELDSKLYLLSEKCLIVGTYYSQLCRFINENRLLCAGRVNQALSAALDTTLNDYKRFMLDLQVVHKIRKISLQELYFHLQDIITLLELLNEIVDNITMQQLRGGSTLSYLHRQTLNYIEPQENFTIMKHLTKIASKPYFESVQDWIFNGIIFDPFDEFMILEKPKTSLTQTVEFWEKRYLLRKTHAPIFLDPAVNEIFKSGAYLNVIKESVSQDNKLELADIELIKYSSKSSKYMDKIKEAYIFSSSHLLSLMLEKYQLIERFSFMRRYFLLQQGEFIAQVLDTCDDELSKYIRDIIPSRMETLVDMAIKGIEDSIRDDLKISFHPQDLCHQVSKILSVTSTDEPSQKIPAQLNTDLTGYESFTLDMNCKWPVSLIFNTRIISCYQMLFRLLFYCKHIESLLSRVWILDQRLRKLPNSQMQQYVPAFALRHKMMYFIQNMQYYMMEEAIEPNWMEFQTELKKLTSAQDTRSMPVLQFTSRKVNSIDDLILLHKRFLDNCMSDCLLTNAKLFPIFKSLLEICKNFVSFIISHVESSLNIITRETFRKRIIDLGKEFDSTYITFLTTIVELSCTDEESTKVSEIFRRANFNDFFTKMMST